ncbi:MAG: SMC-Scp complex subunit ScpB [Anaerolineae bacterium]|nr:SMC-Scp complex subunit ScpB [Anaerolineae bacterium]
MVEESTPENLDLEARIEALLFVAPGAVSLGQLAKALDVSQQDVKKGLTSLEVSYARRGVRLHQHRGQVQMTSAPETARLVEEFLSLEATTRLSRAALETLAIIAYQQPVTRPQIDSIRGVNSDGVMRTLLSKGLVEEAGRAEGPGRPILYNTTTEFLQHFGLTSIKDLPPLANEAMIGSEPMANGSDDNQLSLLKE